MILLGINVFRTPYSLTSSDIHASLMLDELVSEPYPKYYREKYGPSYIYRKTGT